MNRNPFTRITITGNLAATVATTETIVGALDGIRATRTVYRTPADAALAAPIPAPQPAVVIDPAALAEALAWADKLRADLSSDH